MRTLAKITTTIGAALMLAMTTSMMFATAQAESSIRVTQSTEDGTTSSLTVRQSSEDGLKVECEGNLECEIKGDNTVVATSDDDDSTTTSATAITTNNLNQSNTIQSGSDFDEMDHQDLDRLLEEISGKLANLAISI
jgi:hypothetical protein